jgi:hypothetical protein
MTRSRVVAAGTTVLAAVAFALLPTTGANAVTKTFYGYGYLPSDAHAAAVAAMSAYSSSCQEVSTTYSPAGSEHYWQATLTANC